MFCNWTYSKLFYQNGFYPFNLWFPLILYCWCNSDNLLIFRLNIINRNSDFFWLLWPIRTRVALLNPFRKTPIFIFNVINLSYGINKLNSVSYFWSINSHFYYFIFVIEIHIIISFMLWQINMFSFLISLIFINIYFWFDLYVQQIRFNFPDICNSIIENIALPAKRILKLKLLWFYTWQLTIQITYMSLKFRISFNS